MGNITNINHDQDLFTNTINVRHFYILTHIKFYKAYNTNCILKNIFYGILKYS